MYHDKKLGELYDLQADPREFEDLWDSVDRQQIKQDLIRNAFAVSYTHLTLQTIYSV